VSLKFLRARVTFLRAIRNAYSDILFRHSVCILQEQVAVGDFEKRNDEGGVRQVRCCSPIEIHASKKEAL
jgi:hypothetical protein